MLNSTSFHGCGHAYELYVNTPPQTVVGGRVCPLQKICVCPVHGCTRAWCCCCSSEHYPGFTSEDWVGSQDRFHLVQRLFHWHLLHSLVFAWCMHCSLERWCQANNQLDCPFVLPICGIVQRTVFVYLDTIDSHRTSLTCLILFVDRSDLFLQVTEIRLGLVLSTFSVATPPLAAWSIASVGTSSDEDTSVSSEAD